MSVDFRVPDYLEKIRSLCLDIQAFVEGIQHFNPNQNPLYFSNPFSFNQSTISSAILSLLRSDIKKWVLPLMSISGGKLLFDNRLI